MRASDAEAGVARRLGLWLGRLGRLTPTPAGKGVLLGVVSVSAKEAWAVGGRGSRALIEHWDGRRWSVAASPDVGASVLMGIDAVSTDDVWAVGDRRSYADQSAP